MAMIKKLSTQAQNAIRHGHFLQHEVSIVKRDYRKQAPLLQPAVQAVVWRRAFEPLKAKRTWLG